MSNPILNFIINELYLYKKLFPDGGSIPLDTLECRNVYFSYIPDSGPVPNEFYFKILETAIDNFNNFSFTLHFDEIEHPEALGPNRIWLKYSRKPDIVKVQP